jgi:hypothetical protein
VNVHPCILQRRKLLRKYCDGPCSNDAGDLRQWAPMMRPVLMLHLIPKAGQAIFEGLLGS